MGQFEVYLWRGIRQNPSECATVYKSKCIEKYVSSNAPNQFRSLIKQQQQNTCLGNSESSEGTHYYYSAK